MKPLSAPLDEVVAGIWQGINPAYRKAFLWALVVNLLAFGYEMTNLTLNQDDVAHIFIQDTILGHYLGRFGLGSLHYYTQNAHIMPFLQMAQSMALMSVYGVLVSKLWGLTRTLDVVLVSTIMSVFPFMAQIYQYNTAVATYPVAHLLAALAIFLSVQGRVVPALMAALLYVAAFSIYQSVVANAATLFLIWWLATLLFDKQQDGVFSKKTVRAFVAALLSVIAGGLVYVAIVASMHIPFDSYQEAGSGFALSNSLSPWSLMEVVKGTRSSLLWPENYFPSYLKNLQVVFLAVAAAVCLWVPKGFARKGAALALLAAALFAPRLLQIVHPLGDYNNRSLTAYAVLVAGCVMMVLRAGSIPLRNLTQVFASVLVAGYVLQCNWISVVGQLNTYAHTSTVNQIINRVWALPPEQWKGGEVVVVGSYDMPGGYPFKGAAGVANEFVDAAHMQHFARLMRKDIAFVPFDAKTMPVIAQFAASRPSWPRADSVGVVDGVAVVVLSR